MEILRKVSERLGNKLVKREGDVNIPVNQALTLWIAHLSLLIGGTSEDTGDHSIGRGEIVPVVYGKPNSEIIDINLTPPGR